MKIKSRLFGWRLRLRLFLRGIRIKNLPLSHQPVEELIGYPVDDRGHYDT